MPTYAEGDFIKVEFADQLTGVGEWLWVRVRHCDDARRIVFGVLDNVPLGDQNSGLSPGAELAISFEQVRERRKPFEFRRGSTNLSD